MKIGRVSSQYVQHNANRFEGKYYLNDNSYNSMIIENNSDNTNPLEYYAFVFNPPVFKRQFCKKTERSVPYFQSSDVSNSSEFSTEQIFKAQAKSLNLLVKTGDILVTGFGTIGNTRLVNKHQNEVCYANNVCRIRVNEGEKNGFIYAFLSSKYGRSQLNKNASGSVVRYIEAPGIKRTLIPVFPEDFQEKVDALIQDSARLREEATEELEKAKRMIEEFVGISKFNLSYQTQILSSKNINSRFKRLDSQYQIGKFYMDKEKQNLDTIKIRDIAYKILVGNRGKREYVDKNGIPFLSSSDMMMSNPLRQAKQIRKNSQNIGNLLVTKNDILISRSGTVGNTIIVGDDLNGVAVSEHAMKLGINPDLMPPEYVFAYFQTKQGQNSLKILPYGSVIITLGEDYLGDVDLPIIPKELMDKVVSLVREYITNNDIANQKETQAISLVEAEIEKWDS